MKKILVYPYYNSPYQSLLYNEVKKNPDITIKYLRSKYDKYLLLIDLPLLIIKNRFLGFSIFHLHWVPFNPFTKNKINLFFFLLYTFFLVIFIKLIGYKLVWTIHNIIPNEVTTTNDLFITKLLCKISDRKIVHSQWTIDELEKFGCSVQNTTIIPHGNYVSYYKDRITKTEARKFLKIQQHNFVFLFFGELKKYKGIEEVLRTFNCILDTHKNVTLLVAGKVYEGEVAEMINKQAAFLKNNVSFYLKHIQDDEVQYFMQAADIVVYAFKKITTSGSVILALSFGKPIIYPKIGELAALPDTIGFSYLNSEKDSLYKAMIQAITANKETLHEQGKHAYHYAQSLSWDQIAMQTIQLYKTI